jgi:hypothetical protein
MKVRGNDTTGPQPLQKVSYSATWDFFSWLRFLKIQLAVAAECRFQHR